MVACDGKGKVGADVIWNTMCFCGLIGGPAELKALKLGVESVEVDRRV